MDLDPRFLALGVLWYVAFLFSTTVHEAAHALAALRLGDPTASRGGQVSLNPWPHIRRAPVGTVLVPIVSYLFAGWVMGWASAPYDPRWADRHPRRAAWMALAGPASNFVLMILSGLGLRAGLAAGFWNLPTSPSLIPLMEAEGAANGAATFLSILFVLNLVLFVFNLLPVPPLDGSGALPLILPNETARQVQEFLRQPGFALLGLVIAWNVFGELFSPLLDVALRALYWSL